MINGDRPWDMQVKDDRIFRRVVLYGSLGLGESYMDGDWDARQLDEFFSRLLRARIHQHWFDIVKQLQRLQTILFNRQALSRAFQVGKKHYDMDDDFFRAMLGERMVYTCAYWKNADNLDEAQEQKLDLVCRKLKLRPDQTVLDIGCGWGSFARFAAENYGARVTGITISKSQAEYAREMCKDLPVEIRLQDYRLVDDQFDHIVSLGMFEHVGRKNYRQFMEVARRCLKDDEGIFLLHTIGKEDTSQHTDPWIEKYIFPNGEIPALQYLIQSCDDLFVLEDLHNFGADYDKTLMSWYSNFDTNWEKFKPDYGQHFYRMWKYYLNCCAGAFRSRNLQLWQLVLTREGLLSGYQRPSM